MPGGPAARTLSVPVMPPPGARPHPALPELTRCALPAGGRRTGGVRWQRAATAAVHHGTKSIVRRPKLAGRTQQRRKHPHLSPGARRRNQSPLKTMWRSVKAIFGGGDALGSVSLPGAGRVTHSARACSPRPAGQGAGLQQGQRRTRRQRRAGHHVPRRRWRPRCKVTAADESRAHHPQVQRKAFDRPVVTTLAAPTWATRENSASIPAQLVLAEAQQLVAVGPQHWGRLDVS